MKRLADLMQRSIAPDKRLSVVEWCEKYIFLSERVSPDFPGPYTTSLTPYVRAALEWFGDPSIKKSVMCWASQTAKSLTLICGAAYRLGCRPTNITWGAPTIDFARRFSQTKLQPVLRECAGLAAEMPTDPDEFKILEMHFARASLLFAWSNSPQSLSSSSTGLVIGDEIDKWGKASADEADPVKLLLERLKYSPLGLAVLASTPSTENGAIWKEYLASDCRIFSFPSPHTGDPMCFEFEGDRLKWDPAAKDETGRWDLERVRKSAYYECPHSGKPITDSMKIHALRKGVWTATNPHAQAGCVGTRLPSFYSPTISFGRMAVEFLESKNDFFGMQNFYNSWLALPFKNLANKTEEEDILKHRAGYRRGTIPKKPLTILIGADVGQSYVRWVAGAFSENGELWIIDWGTEAAPGAMLELVQKARWKCLETGEDLSANFGWIDAKYRRDEVHKTCFNSNQILWPAAGTGGTYSSRGVWFGPVSPYPAPYGLTSYNDRDFKTKLYIDRIKKGNFPGIHFPENLDELLVKELCSEELRENEEAHASKRYEWKRTGDNHLGDAVKLLLVAWEYLTMAGAPDPQNQPAADPENGARIYQIKT